MRNLIKETSDKTDKINNERTHRVYGFFFCKKIEVFMGKKNICRVIALYNNFLPAAE